MLSSRFTSCLSRSRSIHRSYVSTSSVQLSGDVPADRVKVAQFSDLSNIPGVAEKDLKLCLKPYIYHSSTPLKKSGRLIMIDGFNYWLNLPSDLIARIEPIIDIIWESAIMEDDIDDSSEFRRGFPAAHKLYGKPRTRTSGRAVYSLLLKELIELGNMKAIVECNNEHIRFHTGQSKEMYHREHQICPTLEEFEQICSYKATPFINMIVKIMQAFSDLQTDFSRLSDLIGIHLQYVNDTSNLSDEKCWNYKGFCDDFLEGTYTLPVIHAIRSGTPEGKIISAILRQPKKDLPTMKYCLSLLEKIGSIEFANKTGRRFEKEIRNEIEKLGGNPRLVKYLDTINELKYEEEC